MPDEKLIKLGEETKALGRPWNVVYNYKGEVFCVNPNEDEQRERWPMVDLRRIEVV